MITRANPIRAGPFPIRQEQKKGVNNKQGGERLERHHIAVRPLASPNITMEFMIGNNHARHSGGRGMVVLRLQRTYHGEGTNGTLGMAGQPICHTIELPWRNNRRNKSSIPEGRYRLRLFPSVRSGMRICVEGVPKRSGILIHPANNAATELRGCIAPVTKLTGHGKGVYSRVALERLERLLLPLMEDGVEVVLDIAPRLGTSSPRPLAWQP